MQLIFSLIILNAQSRNSVRGPNPDCESQEESTLCETDCENEHVECLKECDSDTTCTSDCTRKFSDCIELCPCLGILFILFNTLTYINFYIQCI